MVVKVIGEGKSGNLLLQCSCGHKFYKDRADIKVDTRCMYCSTKEKPVVTKSMLTELFELFNLTLSRYKDGK